MSETHEEILPTHWEEWEENVKYTIDVEIDKEEPWLIRRLEIYETEYHDGNYVSETTILEIKEGNYCVERYKIRMNWNGTGRDDILTLTFNDYADEPLLIFYYDEISQHVNEHGVKETIEYIKNFIVDAIATSLTDKLCELKEIY